MRVTLAAQPEHRMDAHLIATHAYQFATCLDVKRQVELLRVEKEKMRAEHHVEGAIEKRQLWERRTDIAIVDEVRRVVREETLRRRTPAFLRFIDRGKRTKSKQLRLRPRLREHRAIIDVHMLRQSIGATAVKRIHGNRIDPALAGLRRE
jgi:hypothetical protein